MSPSWNKRLRVTISPERISLLKLGRGLKPQLLAKHDEAINASSSQPAWRAALERLDTILSEPAWQNAEVDIVLSNRLVRYAPIQLDPQLKDPAAQVAFAKYSLTQIYGPVVKQWESRIQRNKLGKSWLVCAVDKALLDRLRQVCAAHQLTLRSVTPHLVAVFNSYFKTIGVDAAWLVIHEPGYSLFALLRDGEFEVLSGASHDSIQALPLLLDRENLSSSMAEPCKSVYLHAPSGSDVSEIPKHGYEFKVLGTAIPEEATSFLEGVRAKATSLLTKRPLQLDFQQAVGAPKRLAGWILLLAGVALLAEMGFSYDKLQQDRAVMYQEMRDSNLRLDMPREIPNAIKFSDEDFEKGRQIIERLSTPWDEFFVGLESVSNEHAAILSIAPDMQNRTLRLEGEAKDYAAVLTLIAQLRTTKPFSHVFLLSHESKRDDPLHPIAFTLSLRWDNS